MISVCTDDTHFEIALAAVKRGLHVMVTKPVVKTLVRMHIRLIYGGCIHLYKKLIFFFGENYQKKELNTGTLFILLSMLMASSSPTK